MFHAAEYVSPGIATVLANTQPVFAAFLAHHLLAERLTVLGKYGMALGFFGIVVIALPELIDGIFNNYLMGVSYILLAALGISIGNVMIKKISDRLDALTAMGWQLLLGAIPLGFISVLTEDPTSITWSVRFLFSLFTLALFETALVY